MSEARQHPYLPKLQEQFIDRKIGRREFLRTATLLGMSAGAAYAFIGMVTGESFVAPARAAMPKGGTLRISIDIQVLKRPHAYNWVQQSIIAGQTVGRLVLMDQENVSRPSLAERWDVSDDLRTWTFHLRKLNWHNGRAFTADDVIWNFKHILDSANGSPSIGLMESYLDANAVEKVDDHTARFNLKVPQLALPEHLDHFTNTIIDPEEGGEFGVGSNGLGAFTLVEHQVGVKAVLEARKEPYFEGGPHLDLVEFIDLGEEAAANLAGLASKQVHGLYQVDIAQLDIVKAIPHIEVYQVPTAATAVVQMIIDRKPYDQPKVRLAMRYGMESTRVLEIAQRNLGLPAEHHLVCPVHPEYAQLPEMTRDPEKARQLLAKAGYPDGIDIEFNCKKDPPWELAAVQTMVEQWKECGIRAKINVMPATQFRDFWDKFDMGFVEWAHRPLGFMVLSLGFRTGAPWNPTTFADKEFDDLLSKAEGTLDVEERRKIMAKVERIMQERGPICQPVWRSLVTAYDKRVKGFRMHPQYQLRCHELAIEA
jgi:peptide/nickel transport system substrate-binding protein